MKTKKGYFKYLGIVVGIMLLSSVVGTASNQHHPPISGTVETLKNLKKNWGGPSTAICTDGTDIGGGNIRVNCDSIKSPHNEMAISVDPSDPTHIVAGSNDYVFSFNGPNIILKTITGGYYTTFNGGTLWTNGQVPNGKFAFAGDPSVAFNKKLGLVHYGVVAFGSIGQDVSVQVSSSADGGKNFGKPVVVALGSGFSLVNDKPYITVDNNPTSSHYGRLYVTWTQFVFDSLGNYIKSPIMLSTSDDGGKTFTAPKEISGSSSTFCANPAVSSNTNICNEDQFSSPVVGKDGTLYVAFENQEFQGALSGFQDQYLIVRSSNGGQTIAGPFQAVKVIHDGSNDYPINADGRQTLSNSQFRLNSAGNLVVDPTSGPGVSTTRLYISFSDNRDGTNTNTNTDIFVVKTENGGSSWNIPGTALIAANDQFYPWASVGNNGVLKVAFSDRSYDSSNIKYGETLASSTDLGTTFSKSEVDTGLSNPDDSRWFSDGTGKTLFLGDYNGLDIGSTGISHPIWTDMRENQFPNPPSGTGHNTEDAVTASVSS